MGIRDGMSVLGWHVGVGDGSATSYNAAHDWRGLEAQMAVQAD